MEKKAQILFVCLGNICRSPMAEAVMRHEVAKAGLNGVIEVDSAGTGDWHLGKPPHEGTRQVLEQHGISYEGMAARQVKRNDYDQFHYIVCMDGKNYGDVRKLFGIGGVHDGAGEKAWPKVLTFMSLMPDRGLEDVPDPYYTGNFDFVYELVEEGCEVLLQKVKSDLGLA